MVRHLTRRRIGARVVALVLASTAFLQQAVSAPSDMGADLSRRGKPDRFREVGFGNAVRIDRERVASAT